MVAFIICLTETELIHFLLGALFCISLEGFGYIILSPLVPGSFKLRKMGGDWRGGGIKTILDRELTHLKNIYPCDNSFLPTIMIAHPQI